MFSVPEWAPSVHPLIVHFPLALLFIAALADVLALIFRRHVWLRWASSGLYALGALSALSAFYSGRDAADSVFLSASGNALLTDHANWATWTVWFYGVYALVRVVFEWKQLSRLKAVQIMFLVVGVAGLFLVKETGEHGAQLVYQHGAGVANAAMAMQAQGIDGDAQAEALEHSHSDGEQDIGNHAGGQDHHDHGDDAHVHTEEEKSALTSHDGQKMFQKSATEIQVLENGWKWDVGTQGAKEFRNQFRMILGDWGDVRVAVDHDNSDENVLTLQTNDAPIMVISDPLIANLQYDLRLNLAAFAGTVRLVHHVQSAENYNFMGISEAEVRLGRVVDGEARIDERGPVATNGWIDVRVVSDGTHFRGYVNKKMVVHGHGAEPEAGLVGLYVQGTGILMIDGFDVQVLR